MNIKVNMYNNLLAKMKPSIISALIAMAVFLIIAVSLTSYISHLMTTTKTGENKQEEESLFNLKSPELYSQPLIISLANNIFTIQPLAAEASSQSSPGQNLAVVKYLEAYTNTDVVQTRYTNKLKEDIILKQPGHPDKFEYQIDITKYDFSKDSQGNIIFYPLGKKDDDISRLFTIPAPFMIDADSNKSLTGDVNMDLDGDGVLTIEPNKDWLAKAAYPVTLDPTIEINILNVHSHPQQGDNWTVSFTTNGQADLKIIPNDQATIDDDEFVSLSCGTENRQPQILSGDVIYYPNWQCSDICQVVHYTKVAGNHTLRFEFGPSDDEAGVQTAFAYNSAGVYYYTTATTGVSWTVPDGVNKIDVKIWGAGGGAGGGSGSGDLGGDGGGGGYASTTLSVTYGETLTIVVGTAGAGGAASGPYGGNGGGYSAIKRNSTFLIMAGGGGGGGGSNQSTQYGGAGGAGGGSNGVGGNHATRSDTTCPSASLGGCGGTGATQLGVGTGGTNDTTGTDGGSGSGNNGGRGGNSGNDSISGAAGGGGAGGTTTQGGGGGGGGGYYGGGGGENAYTSDQGGGGGGGGSATSTGAVNTFILTAGSGSTPGNSGASDRSSYCSTAGNGGDNVVGGAGSAGIAGCVVIRYMIGYFSTSASVKTRIYGGTTIKGGVEYK